MHPLLLLCILASLPCGSTFAVPTAFHGRTVAPRLLGAATQCLVHAARGIGPAKVAQIRRSFPVRFSCQGWKASDANEYRFVDKRKEALLVLPIGEQVRAADVECAITKHKLLLSVSWRRYADGELWGEVKLTERYILPLDVPGLPVATRLREVRDA